MTNNPLAERVAALDERLKATNDRLDKLEPKLDRINDTANRATGWVVGVAAVVGFLSSLPAKALAAFFGVR